MVSQDPVPPGFLLRALAGTLHVDLLALVNLPEGTDSVAASRIRATQLCAGHELALFLLGASLIGAARTAILSGVALPLRMIVDYGALVAAVSLAVAFRRLRTHDQEGGYASLRELRDTAREGLGLAAIWSVPVTLFAEPGTPAASGLGGSSAY